MKKYILYLLIFLLLITAIVSVLLFFNKPSNSTSSLAFSVDLTSYSSVLVKFNQESGTNYNLSYGTVKVSNISSPYPISKLLPATLYKFTLTAVSSITNITSTANQSITTGSNTNPGLGPDPSGSSTRLSTPVVTVTSTVNTPQGSAIGSVRLSIGLVSGAVSYSITYGESMSASTSDPFITISSLSAGNYTFSITAISSTGQSSLPITIPVIISEIAPIVVATTLEIDPAGTFFNYTDATTSTGTLTVSLKSLLNGATNYTLSSTVDSNMVGENTTSPIIIKNYIITSKLVSFLQNLSFTVTATMPEGKVILSKPFSLTILPGIPVISYVDTIGNMIIKNIPLAHSIIIQCSNPLFSTSPINITESNRSTNLFALNIFTDFTKYGVSTTLSKSGSYSFTTSVLDFNNKASNKSSPYPIVFIIPQLYPNTNVTFPMTKWLKEGLTINIFNGGLNTVTIVALIVVFIYKPTGANSLLFGQLTPPISVQVNSCYNYPLLSLQSYIDKYVSTHTGGLPSSQYKDYDYRLQFKLPTGKSMTFSISNDGLLSNFLDIPDSVKLGFSNDTCTF